MDTLPIDLVQKATSFGLRHGMDVNLLLHEAGIPPMLLTNGRSRVTEAQATSVVRALWRVTDDEMFGLGDHPLPRGSFRLLCYGVIGAADIEEAVERFRGFARAMPAMPPIELTREVDLARLSFGLSRMKDDHEHLMTMTALAVTHRMMSWAIGRQLDLRQVLLPYSEPADLESHRLVFGAPLLFDAGEAALVFDAEALRAPLVRDEKELDEFIARSPAGLLARTTYDTTDADRVRKLVQVGVRSRRVPSGDEVADRLAISPQTLRRRLAAEGTSLREIRDEVLRDVAVTSLVRGDESIAALSERLGFSEPSAFTRAFRRWTGSPPGAYREEA